MANLQVLVVDDDEVIRLLCADLLSDMGYEVTCAADGQEAVSHLKRAVFDLVLLDLDLPLLRGQEVLQIMRTELASEALVIIMSAWISEDTRRFGEKYGVLAYLEKPFDLDDLTQLLQELPQRPKRPK
ncbi:MAG TPA: response regulator [Armatimonadetes bacterium]|nr:response regulator [Armatimonadota bacterium]